MIANSEYRYHRRGRECDDDRGGRHRASRQERIGHVLLGVGLCVTLSDTPVANPNEDVDILALDEAMHELEALDERKARVVELRFFGGLTNTEVAEVIEMAPKTAEADWYMARAWLRKRLSS